MSVFTESNDKFSRLCSLLSKISREEDAGYDDIDVMYAPSECKAFVRDSALKQIYKALYFAGYTPDSFHAELERRVGHKCNSLRVHIPTKTELRETYRMSRWEIEDVWYDRNKELLGTDRPTSQVYTWRTLVKSRNNFDQHTLADIRREARQMLAPVHNRQFGPDPLPIQRLMPGLV